MAEEKKTSSAVNGNEQSGSKTAKRNATSAKKEPKISIEDKLKLAEGNIERTNSDAEARRQEQAQQKREARRQAKEKLAEDKRRQRLQERQVDLIMEQRTAAFEYAKNYREKLEKEKQRTQSKAKLRREEELRLEKEREKAAREEEIRQLLEKEREEARARSERAAALLNRVRNRLPADEGASVAEADKVEEPKVEEPKVEEPKVEEPKHEVIEEPKVEEPKVEEPKVEEPKVEEPTPVFSGVKRNVLTEEERRDAVLNLTDGDDSPEEEEEVEKEIAVSMDEDAFVLSVGEDDEADMTVEFDDTTYEIVDAPKAENPVTEEPAPVLEEPVAEEPETEVALAPEKKEPELVAVPVIRKKEKEPIKVVVPYEDEELEAEEPVPEPPEEPKEDIRKATPILRERYPEVEVLEDDIVRIIKDEGARVEDKKQLKRYLKKSDKAVRVFEKNIEKALRRLDKKSDENDSPATVVEIIQTSARILHIRCDNLAVCARVGNRKQIKKYHNELHEQINAYNGKVISYASLTGEQLSRISSFLPDTIKEGSGEAVIPELSYRESYVELQLDKNGNLPADEDNVTTTVISPDISAAELFANPLIETKEATVPFGKRSRKADKAYLKEIESIKEEIEKNEKKNGLLTDKENKLTDEYRRSVAKLEGRVPPSKRAKPKYQKRLNSIKKKYSKKINAVRLAKTTLSSERKNTKLLASTFALERERLVVAAAVLRGVNVKKSEKKHVLAKRALIGEMMNYNRLAAKCSDALGIELTKIAGAAVDEINAKEKNVFFPKIAYRRELIETVGEEERVIGDRYQAPEVLAAEPSAKIEDVFEQDKTTEDRGATLEALMINDLREKSEAVNSKWSFKKYFKYAKKVRRRLEKTVDATEYSIVRAFDRNDVIFSIVESLRIRGKIIELGVVNMTLSTKMRMKKRTAKEAALLSEDIARYNEKVLDYATLTGEQFNRVSALLPEELQKRSCEIYVPSISYRESYIEVYPKDASVDMFFLKPERRSATDYIPLAFKNRRLTENNSVEVTVINSPHIAEEYLYGPPATKVIHHWYSEGMSDFIEIRLKKALKKVKKRIKQNDKLDREFEIKLGKLNKKLDDKIFKLESANPGADRLSDSYRQKVILANKKFSKELSKLRIRRAAAAIERKRLRLIAEQFVIEREFLVVSCRKLFILRSYGWRGVLRDAKREVIDRIERYNVLAKKFSEMLGEPIAQASTTIADEIIKYGKNIVFPYIAMCKELIETLADKPRVIGEKYRGSMRMGVDIKGVPIMQSLPTDVPSMATRIASPTVGVDAYGNPVIGATHSGLIYLGANVSPELNAQFIESNDKKASVSDAKENTKPQIVTPYDAVTPGAPLVGIPANVSSEFYKLPDNITGADQPVGGGSKIFPINPLAGEIEEFAVDAIKAQSRTITTLGQWRRHIYRSWLTRKRLNSALRYTKRKRVRIPVVTDKSGLTALDRANEAIRNFYLLQEMVVQGMIVEVRCANLYAISKLGIWWRVRNRTEKLKDDIKKYNEYIAAISGADEFDLTSISMLVADRIANKTGEEIIPRAHIRESFVEVDDVNVGNAVPILPTISADKKLADIPVTDRESFLYYEGRANSLINRIDSQTAKHSKILKKRINKLRWFRRRKVRATAKYHRRVFELSCNTDSTSKYQKKLHRIKWRYSKLLFKITRRETTPLNSIRLFFSARKKYQMSSYIGLDDLIDCARIRDLREQLNPKKEKMLADLAADMTAREAKDQKFINTLTKFSLNAEKNRIQVEKKYALRRARDEAHRKLTIENIVSGKEKRYRAAHWFLYIFGRRDEAFIGKRDPYSAPLENTPERNILRRVALEREKVMVSAKVYAKLTSAISALEVHIAEYEAAPTKAAKAQYVQDKADVKSLRRLLPRVTREFSTVVSRYNTHISEASYSLRIPTTEIDNDFIKTIEISGQVPSIPRLAWKGEIVEQIGEEERYAGNRRVM